MRVLLAALVAAAALVAGALALTGDDAWHVEAALTDAGGLGTSDRAKVTLAGIRVGEVDGVAVREGSVVVRLRLDDDARGVLREGATAEVRPRSALNDLEVALTAGPPAARALGDGARIPARDTSRAVAADEVLSTLDVDTRVSLQVLVGELSAAAGDARGSRLARLLERLDPATASAHGVARALAERRRLVARLVGRLDRVARVTARRGAEVRRVVPAARRTLDVVARSDEAVGTTLRELPATLRDVRGALDEVQRLSTPLVPALERLRPAAAALPGALAALRQATPAARGLLADARALGRSGAGPAADLRSVARDLGPVARGLAPATSRADGAIKDIDRNRDGIGLLGERFTGIFSTNDVNGPILRGLGFFEPFDPAHFGFPGATGAERARVAAGVVRALRRVCETDNVLACLVPPIVPGLPGARR